MPFNVKLWVTVSGSLLSPCCQDGKNDHLTWAVNANTPVSLSASSTCLDTLHSARHREGSGISQRHHWVWTATAWPLQVCTYHVAPTGLHHKHALPVVCWVMDSLNASWKCPEWLILTCRLSSGEVLACLVCFILGMAVAGLVSPEIFGLLSTQLILIHL